MNYRIEYPRVVCEFVGVPSIRVSDTTPKLKYRVVEGRRVDARETYRWFALEVWNDDAMGVGRWVRPEGNPEAWDKIARYVAAYAEIVTHAEEAVS